MNDPWPAAMHDALSGPMTETETAIEERREQEAALLEIDKASLTLGEAEDVFRQAVDGMERVIHDAAVVGVPLDLAMRRALGNPGLHALASGQVLVIVHDETRRAELAAAPEMCQCGLLRYAHTPAEHPSGVS